MYKVMIVDDEPASGRYIQKLLELKCPECEVCATACDGEEALEKLKQQSIDIVFSDIKMPTMDGITLVTRVSEIYPETMTVIISGYQDFEFAKGAIQAGVCDYLLKPVDPGEISPLMKKVEAKVDKVHYIRRKRVFSQILTEWNKEPEKDLIMEVFEEERYYLALLRVGPLPVRAAGLSGIEYYSESAEKIISYGRDPMERLMLSPASLFRAGEFREAVKRASLQMRGDGTFVTVLMSQCITPRENLTGIIRDLYQQIEQTVVIGEDTLRIMNIQEDKKAPRNPVISFSDLEHAALTRNKDNILNETEKLMNYFEKIKSPQRQVEEYVRQILFIVQKAGLLEKYDTNTISDIFSEVQSSKELKDNLRQFLMSGTERGANTAVKGTADLFPEILCFLEQHSEEDLSIRKVCDAFGVSQTTLSRMFREKKTTSFGNYLTQLRIKKARSLLEKNPGIYIRDVAEAVGYRDQFYFSRIFRSVVGVPPSEYIGQNLEQG